MVANRRSQPRASVLPCLLRSFRDELAASRTFLLESETAALARSRHRRTGDAGGPLDFRRRMASSATCCVIPTNACGTSFSTWWATWLFWALTFRDSWSPIGPATRPTTRSRAGCSTNCSDRQPSSARGRVCSCDQGVIDITGIMSLLPHRYPFLAGRQGSRARTGSQGRRDQKRECQRAIFSRTLARTADNARCAHHRGAGASRRSLDLRQRRACGRGGSS